MDIYNRESTTVTAQERGLIDSSREESRGYHVSCNRLLNSVWALGLDVGDGLQQVVDDGLALVVANLLDILQLLLGILAGILLGLVVAAGVLEWVVSRCGRWTM